MQTIEVIETMKVNKLHNIKSTGFKTPPNYFASLEDAVLSNKKSRDLSEKVTEHGFGVPQGYFDQLEHTLAKTATQHSEPKTIPLFHWKKIAYISGIAASLILAFNVFFGNQRSLTFAELETASIENYLMTEGLSTHDLSQFFVPNSLNTSYFFNNTIDQTYIEEYLLQDSDLEHLISEP
ncbi:MAG TPA: hypothetical protein PKI08_05700 [Aquaticitalea sp.]|nr:hypothetical protein [Aquaticitalea sp.]